MGEFIQSYNPTKGQKEKAVRFLKTDKVNRLRTDVFEVEGDTGKHIVILFEDENRPHVCSCQRTDTCSHIMAAMTLNDLPARWLHSVDGDKVKTGGPSMID